jgi:pyrimidine operon attenuation protein/uracil phosphoribosyltransferase
MSYMLALDPLRLVQRGEEGTVAMKAVLSSADISRALTRISHEIIEKNRGSEDILLLGIPTRGIHLAERIGLEMSRIDSSSIPVGTLDITLHRDDLRSKPPRALTPTKIPPSGINGKRIVLVDDVLYSGRTIRAALDALGEIGRPAMVQLAVLIDRGHRELPIRADYVGKNLPTSHEEIVKVSIAEVDGEDLVQIAASHE